MQHQYFLGATLSTHASKKQISVFWLLREAVKTKSTRSTPNTGAETRDKRREVKKGPGNPQTLVGLIFPKCTAL